MKFDDTLRLTQGGGTSVLTPSVDGAIQPVDSAITRPHVVAVLSILEQDADEYDIADQLREYFRDLNRDSDLAISVCLGLKQEGISGYRLRKYLELKRPEAGFI